jgi:hypothetical protein
LGEWLPHHLLEPGVRGDYAGQIHNHLIPFFGPMKMRDIMPEQVRQWVTYMKDKGAKARTIEYCKRSILNAIFSTAMMDNVTGIHPCHGVKIPAVPQKPRSIITAAQSTGCTVRFLTPTRSCSSRPTSRAACDGVS